MKTTWDLPEDLLREIRIRAAREGRPMRFFVIEALRRHLQQAEDEGSRPPWRKFFGVVSPEEVAEVDAAVRESCEEIRDEDWH